MAAGRITDSKSAANDLGEPTFLIASRSAEAHWSAGHPAFVGCICELGGGPGACTGWHVPLPTTLQYLVPPAIPGGPSRTWRFVWQRPATDSTNSTAFERTSKRRKGYPSETRVKRGYRLVHGDKELIEKLGRNDLCPCGSGRRFQALLPWQR